MLSYYSNRNICGLYFIVTYILTETNSTNGQSWLRAVQNKSGDFHYEYTAYQSCLTKENGNSTHVYLMILKPNGTGNKNYINIDLKNSNNSIYKDHIEQILRDCNGRAECNSSYSEHTIPRPMFQPSFEYIDVRYMCKPAKSDNSTVFNISLNLDIKESSAKKTYYLVLDLQNNENTHRHCKIGGSKISITVLYVDFRPKSKCNKSNSDSLEKCHENMTTVSNDSKECNYTWSSSVTFQIINCRAKSIDIEFFMSTGFVWIEFEVCTAEKDFYLNCNGSKSSTDVTDSGSSATPDSNQLDIVLNIAIPVSVAFLILLIAFGSFVFCVCRRNSQFQIWKQSRGESALRNKRDDKYANVTLNEVLDDTYNTVDSPVASPTNKRTIPDNNAIDDYAEIPHGGKSTVTKPRVPSAPHQTSLISMKPPATSSEPSFKKGTQDVGDSVDALETMYAQVNKGNKVKQVETSVSSSAGTAYTNITDASVLTSHQEDAEYSQLGHTKKKRNYKNVYNC